MLRVSELINKLTEALWQSDLSTLPAWKAFLIQVLRLIYVLIRDVADGQLTLRAMSLVYTTLLSLVPLLAVSFSVLKAFGVSDQIRPLLANVLAPLGEKGAEVSSRVIQFVDNMKVGLLGSMGLALLIYTVVSLIQKVERAFNYTWHVSHHRPLSQRFSDYLSVILIGPVLVFSAMGITASAMSNSLVQKVIGTFGASAETVSRVIPYALIIGAFTFIYIFIPNTKVRARSALVGALVAGVLWETVGWLFASFVVTSTKYTAIYSTFATLIMFMIWLYMSWLILLVGASIAFYHQHPEFLIHEKHDLRLSNRLKEKLVLTLMVLIARNFQQDEPPWSADALAHHLAMPLELIDPLIEVLEQQRLLTAIDAEPPAYLPARPLEHIELTQIINAVRRAEETATFNIEHLPDEPAVDALLTDLGSARDEALRGRTLRDLVIGSRTVAPSANTDN